MKKLKLKDISVQSFVTTDHVNTKSKTIKGGVNGKPASEREGATVRHCREEEFNTSTQVSIRLPWIACC